VEIDSGAMSDNAKRTGATIEAHYQLLMMSYVLRF
jgi:hypothetical protein